MRMVDTILIFLREISAFSVLIPIHPTFRRLVKKEDNIFDKERPKTGESIAFHGLS